MPTPPDLTTLELLEEFYEDIPTELEGEAQKLIASVSQKIKRFCGTDFYTATYTEYFDGSGGRSILLSQFPVISITSIYDDPNRTWGSSYLVPTDIYSVNLKLGIITLNPSYRFREFNGNVRVIYTAGYGSTFNDLPMDLKEVATKWVAILWKSWEGQFLGVQSVKTADLTTIFDKASPPKEIRGDLMRFRNRA